MRWVNRSFIESPSVRNTWRNSHASIPTPLLKSDGNLRVYINCRDQENISRVAWMDFSSLDPVSIIGVSDMPCLEVGEAGCFDDNGVNQCSVIRNPGGGFLMYYVGFELCHKIRYRMFTGLAVSETGDFFTRTSSTPILDRTADEQFFRCGPFVLHNGENFEMWYVAGGKWTLVKGVQKPIYKLRKAKSAYADFSQAEFQDFLDPDEGKEFAFGRPWVCDYDQGYDLFYSIRNYEHNYILGYAQVDQNDRIKRLDQELGVRPGDGSHCRDMQCYASIVDFQGKRFMLFNGDDFGRDGFFVMEWLKG